MTKSEQQQVRQVVNTARSHPHYAAAVLAPLLRSCSKKSFPELMDVMNSHSLRDYMEVVNGCYVAKQPA